VGLTLPERLGTGLDVKVGCEGSFGSSSAHLALYDSSRERPEALQIQ
jgi:hypothetical protein